MRGPSCLSYSFFLLTLLQCFDKSQTLVLRPRHSLFTWKPRCSLHHQRKRHEPRQHPKHASTTFARPTHFWEGDDIRWSRKFVRRFRQTFFYSSKTTPARTILIAINLVAYLYQVTVAVNFIRIKFPQYWPSGAPEIILDSLLGSARPGPLTLDFGLLPGKGGSQPLPHRYFTTCFLHGGILHLLANIDALRRLPSWIESGMGAPLYLTTYLLSMVAGNVGAQAMNYDTTSSFCLGFSGGIAGLYGLLFVSLSRMGNRQAFSWVARGMGLLFLYGLLFGSVSNATHVVGFVCGAAIAILFGPTYRRSYSMRRKGSVEVDPITKGYRAAMGFGTLPQGGLMPLAVLWLVVVATILSTSRLRSIPSVMLQGLIRPGSISGVIRYR